MTIRKYLKLLSLLAVLWVSFFSGLANYALIDLVDEGFYASASRQMLETGDWITPRVGELVFLGKPPLIYWAQALFIRLLGPSVLAARLPSALAAAATSLVLWWWMKRRGDERVGWLAAIFYALCPLSIGLARVAMTDALLTLWLTIAIIGLIEGYEGKTKCYLLSAAGAALATLTKGPIGFLLPGTTFLVWLIWKRDLKELRKPIWLAVLLLFAVIALPWHVAVWRVNGNYFLREYFWQHHLQRAFGGAFGHERPFWFYVPVLICSSFPFIVFVPHSWWKQITRLRQRKGGSDWTGMWMLWASLVFLIFSLSPSKLSSYMLPVLPAVALLAAQRVNEMIEQRRGLSRIERFLGGFVGIFAGSIFLVSGVLGLTWRSHPSPVPYFAKLLSGTIGWQSGAMSDARVWYRLSPFILLAPHTLVFGLVVLILTTLILCWRRQPVRVIGAAAALGLSLAVIASHLAMPAWSRFDIEPLWQLAEMTRPSLAAGEPLILYGIHPARTSVRYLLGHTELITETTDAPVLQQVVKQYPHGYILSVGGDPLPTVAQTTQVERQAGRWALWRFGQ